MLFIDVGQNIAIDSARRTADQAKQGTKRFERRVTELERRTDRLALACQALWELLQERSSIPQEAVFDKMAEIDLRDGTADGRIGARVMSCENCGRKCNSHRPACVYCGHVNRGDHIVG